MQNLRLYHSYWFRDTSAKSGCCSPCCEIGLFLALPKKVNMKSCIMRSTLLSVSYTFSFLIPVSNWECSPYWWDCKLHICSVCHRRSLPEFCVTFSVSSECSMDGRELPGELHAAFHLLSAFFLNLWICSSREALICWSLMKLGSIEICIAATLNLPLTCEMLALNAAAGQAAKCGRAVLEYHVLIQRRARSTGF